MDINIQSITTAIPPQAASEALHTEKIAPRPVAASERIKTIDIIRGVALFGILLMNIPGFGFAWNGFDEIHRGPHNTADFYTDAVISTFFEGTMRGLFSMLFGAGMILFTMNKKETLSGPSVAELYYRRLLWLTGFGVVNAFLFLWIGDILFFYGLCGMVLYPFRKTAAKWLFVCGIALIALGMWRNQIQYDSVREIRKNYVAAVAAEKEGKKLTEEQQTARASWPRYERRGPDGDFMQEHVQAMRSDYGTVFSHYLPWNSGNETWGVYQWAFWDCTAMMFIGMALFVLGFFSNRLSSSTYLITLLLGYGIGIPVGFFIYTKGTLGAVNYGAYVDAYRVNHQTLYDVKRVFLSVGHASLVMLVFRSRIIPWLMKGLANVGQMAFTNYLMQSIICTLFFYGYGLGYYNKLKFHQLYYVVGAVWVFQLIASAIWLRYFKFGPFEWAWRSLTYWKKQPMRIQAEKAVA